MKIKKLFLSIAVSLVFVAYSFALRNQGARALVIAPTTLQTKPTTSASTTTPTTSTPTTTTPTTTTPSTGTTSSNTTSGYKDGTYNGSLENAFYGNVEVSATISGGKITNVKFLQYPNDSPNSQDINQQAMPYLQQEAIQAQSANVNIISGATLTSQAFIQSLSSALSKAQA
jgi:uncharacterized protein with FMN-binding domain